MVGVVRKVRVGEIMNFVTMLFGVIAAYFLTLQSLKVELSAKAENTVVATLDTRLSALDVLLRERTVSKEELFRLSQQLELRLTRIEMHLAKKQGEQIESP
jgi:hypothetical protein